MIYLLEKKLEEKKAKLDTSINALDKARGKEL